MVGYAILFEVVRANLFGTITAADHRAAFTRLCLVLFLAVGFVMKILGQTLAVMLTRILGVILAALAAQFIFDGIRSALAV